MSSVENSVFSAIGSVSRQKKGRPVYNSCNDDKMILSKQQISPSLSPPSFSIQLSHSIKREESSKANDITAINVLCVETGILIFHLFAETIKAFVSVPFHHVSSDKSNDGEKKVLSRSSVIIVIRSFCHASV